MRRGRVPAGVLLTVPNNEPKRKVKAVSQGNRRGVLVPISRGQLEEAGLDPDSPIRVNRHVYDTNRAEVRLRMENYEEEGE